MILNCVLLKCTGCDKLTSSQEKMNHLMYTDDMNGFAENDLKKQETRKKQE